MSENDNGQPLGLSPEGLRQAVAELKSHLSSGMTDEQACVEMGLTPTQYDVIKHAMYEQEGAKVKSKSTEQVYLDYTLQQQAVIHDLTVAYERFKSSKQGTAMIGALRARSDVIDKIVKFGQELGLIDKRPERREIVAGIAVAELSDDNLKSMILGELKTVGSMIDQFGDVDITAMPQPQTHFALPEKKDKQPKRKKADTGKVHGGRRVVKEPVL